MNFIKRVLSYLEGERGQFGIPAEKVALSPATMLQEERSRRLEALQRGQMQKQFAIAQRRIAAQQRAAEMQRATRVQQYGLQRGIAAARIRQQQQQFGEEMEARRTGEFFAERAERAPARTFAGAKAPPGYQVGYGKTGERLLEKIKPPKAIKPTWGEQKFMKGFYDTFIDRETELEVGEEKRALALVDRYNKYRSKYNLPEVEIVDLPGPRRRMVVQMKEIGGAFADEREVEKLQRRIKPKEELRIWGAEARADRYGYRKGEMKMFPDQNMYEYIGSDKWRLSTR